MATLPHADSMGCPTTVSWVLARLPLARKLELQDEVDRLRALLALPSVVPRIFDADEPLAAGLLAELPRSAVAPFAGRLACRWHELPDAVAAQAAIRLAELHPPGLVALLLRQVDSLFNGPGDIRLAGAVTAAGRAGPAGIGILDAIEREAGQRLGPYRMLHTGFLRESVRLDRPEAPVALARLLQADDVDGLEIGDALAEVFAELAPGSPMLALVADIEERGFGYRFSDLPELFVPGAPLDDLDALAFLRRGIDFRAGHRLLDGGNCPPHLTRFVRQVARVLSPDTCGFGRRGLFQLLLAAAAQGYAADRPVAVGLSLQELLDLYTCDLADLPCAPALEAAIEGQVTPSCLPVLVSELATCAPYRGGQRMVRLLARYLPGDCFEPLVEALREECDCRTATAAAVELVRRGEAALDLLVQQFHALDFSQRMRTFEILAAAATPRAAAHLAGLLPRVQDDPFERSLWCDAAVLLGDPSLLHHLPEAPDVELGEVRQILSALSREPRENCRKRALQGSNL